LSSSKEFELEKVKIEDYLSRGYAISKVTESLDGAYVEFEQQGKCEDKQSLVLNTADARKYLSSIIFEQQQIKT